MRRSEEARVSEEAVRRKERRRSQGMEDGLRMTKDGNP